MDHDASALTNHRTPPVHGALPAPTAVQRCPTVSNIAVTDVVGGRGSPASRHRSGSHPAQDPGGKDQCDAPRRGIPRPRAAAAPAGARASGIPTGHQPVDRQTSGRRRKRLADPVDAAKLPPAKAASLRAKPVAAQRRGTAALPVRAQRQSQNPFPLGARAARGAANAGHGRVRRPLVAPAVVTSSTPSTRARWALPAPACDSRCRHTQITPSGERGAAGHHQNGARVGVRSVLPTFLAPTGNFAPCRPASAVRQPSTTGFSFTGTDKCPAGAAPAIWVAATPAQRLRPAVPVPGSPSAADHPGRYPLLDYRYPRRTQRAAVRHRQLQPPAARTSTPSSPSRSPRSIRRRLQLRRVHTASAGRAGVQRGYSR